MPLDIRVSCNGKLLGGVNHGHTAPKTSYQYIHRQPITEMDETAIATPVPLLYVDWQCRLGLLCAAGTPTCDNSIVSCNRCRRQCLRGQRCASGQHTDTRQGTCGTAHWADVSQTWTTRKNNSPTLMPTQHKAVMHGCFTLWRTQQNLVVCTLPGDSWSIQHNTHTLDWPRWQPSTLRSQMHTYQGPFTVMASLTLPAGAMRGYIGQWCYTEGRGDG